MGSVSNDGGQNIADVVENFHRIFGHARAIGIANDGTLGFLVLAGHSFGFCEVGETHHNFCGFCAGVFNFVKATGHWSALFITKNKMILPLANKFFKVENIIFLRILDSKNILEMNFFFRLSRRKKYCIKKAIGE